MSRYTFSIAATILATGLWCLPSSMVAASEPASDPSGDTITVDLVPSGARWSAAVEAVDAPQRLFVLDEESDEVYEISDFEGQAVKGLRWRGEDVLEVDLDGVSHFVRIELDEGTPVFSWASSEVYPREIIDTAGAKSAAPDMVRSGFNSGAGYSQPSEIAARSTAVRMVTRGR